MKFTINLKYFLVLTLTLLLVNIVSAQEIIEEETEVEAVAEKESVENANDSINGFKPIKVDGVAAVVGDFIILESDIPKARLELEAGGYATKDITDCELLGKALENKLYEHHAIQDSIQVSNAEVLREVDYTINQFLLQTNGSMERLLAFYKKDDEQSFRDEMFQIMKSNKLSGLMQAKIVDEVEITPEEVRVFFNNIPESERPLYGTELKVAQIVSEPKVAEEEKQRVIEQLSQFKADIIENGASFSSKAVLYSDDPGSASKGGKYTMNRSERQWAKEFRQVAFSLQEGEISDPFETPFGFHIIYVEKIRGQDYDIRHILLIPKVSDEAIKEARERLEKVRESIVAGEISFADAAREASDEQETRGDGGQLINPKTQDYKFDLTKMEPEMYSQIQNLEDGEVSLIQTETDRTGNVKFKILMVTDRINEHEADYARDYIKIRESALNAKKIEAIEKWQDEKIMDTYVKVGENYKDCKFSGNWLKE